MAEACKASGRERFAIYAILSLTFASTSICDIWDDAIGEVQNGYGAGAPWEVLPMDTNASGQLEAHCQVALDPIARPGSFGQKRAANGPSLSI